MGDRTYGSITIYEAPDSAREEIGRLLNDTFYLSDDDPAEWEIDVDYSYDEISLTQLTGTVASRLVELGVTFECSEDNKYEYPGEWVVNIPTEGLGTYRGRFAGEIGPVITDHEALGALDGASSLADARIRLQRLFGLPWMDALTALRNRAFEKEQARNAAARTP